MEMIRGTITQLEDAWELGDYDTFINLWRLSENEISLEVPVELRKRISERVRIALNPEHRKTIEWVVNLKNSLAMEKARENEKFESLIRDALAGQRE